MPSSPVPFPAPFTRPGVIDADYMVVDAPRKGERRAVAPAARSPGLDALRPLRRERLRPFGRRGGARFWGLGLALVLLSFWMSGGHALVRGRTSPPAAPPADAGGLMLAMLDSGVRPMGGRSVLTVEAEVVNAAPAARRAPPVAVLIVSGNGVAMRYVLAASGTEMASGARRRYTSRLAVPAGGVRSVSLAFAS